MHKGFLPLLPGFKYVEFGDLEAVKAAIGPHTAGFLIEPIQGEAAFACPPMLSCRPARAVREHDLLLVFDEVQTGVARTGTFYAYEQFGVGPTFWPPPRVWAAASRWAPALPRKKPRGMVAGTHGSTYGGNPLAMAAASAVLDAVANDEFLAHVRAMGAKLTSRLEQFIGNYPDLFELVRGRGLLLGLKMKVAPRAFVAHLRDNHQLLTVSAGDNTVRILPPLVIDESHIDEFMDKLSAGAASYLPEEA
jgi:acetylornithine/N-succinyldiaminopimelate aminotransferase